MRIAEIIGTVTLNRRHPSLNSGTLRIAVPLSLENLRDDNGAARAEPLVVYDELGAGEGSQVAFSEGREAAMPFEDEVPIDAYVAAILDELHLQSPGRTM